MSDEILDEIDLELFPTREELVAFESSIKPLDISDLNDRLKKNVEELIKVFKNSEK
jgi:hypothetical protein